MYLLLAIFSVVIMIVGGVITFVLAAKQGEEEKEIKVKNRFSNMLWIYFVGIGVAVVFMLVYIFLN